MTYNEALPDADLEAIRDLMNVDTGNGMERDEAVKLADVYVAAHPGTFAQMSKLSYQELVAAVDVFRSAKMFEEQWKVEAYLLHRHPPMHIGGPFRADIRIPNG